MSDSRIVLSADLFRGDERQICDEMLESCLVNVERVVATAFDVEWWPAGRAASAPESIKMTRC